MKRAVIIFLVSLLAPCVLNAPQSSEELTHLKGLENTFDDLVIKVLEYIRTILTKYEPFKVPDLPDQTVSGNDMEFTIQFKDLYVSQASDFTIDHIENSILGFWAKFAVTIPSMQIKGCYSITGSTKGKAISGSGNFLLEIFNFKPSGYVKLGIESYYLQMKELDIDYSLGSLAFNEEGLVIEGMTPEEIKQMFQDSFFNYTLNNKEFISSQVSIYVRQIANGIMKGKGLLQLIKLLDDFIHGRIPV